jgi:hypothetical protein
MCGAEADERRVPMNRFITYAQNFEDVILWRALKHVDRGFYVDCGAYDPTRDSVTKAFYDRGWRGINIEPIPSLLQEFVVQRPFDTNLAIAVSDGSEGGNFTKSLIQACRRFSTPLHSNISKRASVREFSTYRLRRCQMFYVNFLARFAYFDGLNRFYVAKEHSELAKLIAVPPNVFDDFVPVDQIEAEQALEAFRLSPRGG